MSQDLIKKEEERKTMERLLSRDDGSQRRKSFKTYREIVEDKYVLSFACWMTVGGVLCFVVL